MTMTPTRLRECIALPGWSLRKLSRVLGVRSDATLQLGSGKRPIAPELATWLDELAAVWEPLAADLRDIARKMECDAGKFVRRPRGARPITGAEAQLLEAVARFHAERPAPEGWRGSGPSSAVGAARVAFDD